MPPAFRGRLLSRFPLTFHPASVRLLNAREGETAMANAQSIILHHYERSPFAEKVRLALRIRNLAWCSVDAPSVPPKDDLFALTGGYRRIPVMQIGADVYCDTRLILDVLERRFALQPLSLPGHVGTANMVSVWADRSWFPISAGVVFAAIGDKVPEAFRKDREEAFGRPFDPAILKKAEAGMREQWIAQLRWIEDRLDSARQAGTGDFMLGSKPGLVDVHCAYNIWFVQKNAPDFLSDIFRDHPLVSDWYERLYEFEGTEPEILTPEEAIGIAKDAAPRLMSATVSLAPRDLTPGQQVSVTPDDNCKIPVEGKLVHSDATRITVRRVDERAETINVHFPRFGYTVRPVG